MTPALRPLLPLAVLLCATSAAQEAPTARDAPAAPRPGPGREDEQALARCETLAAQALAETDPARREAAFASAVEAYHALFDRERVPELRASLERSYLALVASHGRTLELALAEATGDEANALAAHLLSLLDEALARTNTFDEPGPVPGPDADRASRLEDWRPRLDHAQLLLLRGSLGSEREPFLARAQAELERVIHEAGERSGPGLNAHLALARLARARGDFSAAARHAEHVARVSVPAPGAPPAAALAPEPGDWSGLAPAARAERFALLELALPELVECLAARGERARACAWALFFLDTGKREGFALSPLGTLARLAAARTLLDAGGLVLDAGEAGASRWIERVEPLDVQQLDPAPGEARSTARLALEIARAEKAANRGNTLRLRAQRLLDDALARPDALAPGELLEVVLDEARDAFESESPDAALPALERARVVLDERDEATRRAHLPRVLVQLGETYSRLGRARDAARAFREAATTWAGDAEFQARAAQGLYREVASLRRSAPEDAELAALLQLAERLVAESGPATEAAGAAASIRWRQGERAFAQGDFAAARASFLAIGAAADEHDRSRVKAALCLQRQGDAAGARGELRAYLASSATLPEDGASSAPRRAAREEARAQATYALGKLAAEAGDQAEVLALLAGYADEFPAEDELAPSALVLVLQAQLALHELDDARATAAALEARHPTHALTGKAALALYPALQREEEAAELAGDAPRARALKHERARALALSNRLASEPSFTNLRIESALWLELDEPARAEQALRATAAAFAHASERAADLEQHVLPDLGHVLLAQHRAAEALAVLDALVPKDASDARKPESDVVHDWCRAVTGWLEGDAEPWVEVPGAGGDFERVSALRLRLIEAEKATGGSFGCAWYRLQFERAYDLRQWSRSVPGRRADARRLLEELELYLGDPEFRDVAAKCGDEVLRKRFVWLRNELR